MKSQRESFLRGFGIGRRKAEKLCDKLERPEVVSWGMRTGKCCAVRLPTHVLENDIGHQFGANLEHLIAGEQVDFAEVGSRGFGSIIVGSSLCGLLVA